MSPTNTLACSICTTCPLIPERFALATKDSPKGLDISYSVI